MADSDANAPKKNSSTKKGAIPQTERSSRWGEAHRRAWKTSELISLEIVRDIVSQKLRAGDRLPLESEMIQHYRVSRSSLREALRLLEVQGLIAIRPGPGAGTVVGTVLPGNLARTLMLYFHMSHATYDELLDTWTLTEPLLAEQAAKNPDRERVRVELEPYLIEGHACHGPMREINAGLAFHDVVADLAGNRVLTLLMNVIGFMVAEHVLTTANREELEDEILDDHSAIAKAIIAGDAKKSRKLMEVHVRHVVDAFRTLWPSRVGEKVKLQ